MHGVSKHQVKDASAIVARGELGQAERALRITLYRGRWVAGVDLWTGEELEDWERWEWRHLVGRKD